MGSQPRSRVQGLFTKLVSPAGAARMEAESRTWIVRCPKCGYERSAWDAGNVIYKGAGTRYWFMRCPNCNKSSWNKVYWPIGVKKSDVYAAAVEATGTSSAMAALSDRPPWLVWILAGLAWLGLILGAVFIVGFLLSTLVINPLTQPVVTTGDSFLTALRVDNYDQAYSLCMPELQHEVGGAGGLEKMFKTNEPAQWNWTSRSIRNGAGYLGGSLTFADGTKGTVQLTLTQVGNKWKIVSFSIDPT